MNKKSILLWSFFISGIVMSSTLAVSLSPPPQPIIVYGDFEYSLGNPIVASGVVIDAKIDGVTYESTTTIQNNQYFIQVNTNDSNIAWKNGGEPGDILEFYFDGVLANETLLWPGEAATVNKIFYIHHTPAIAPIDNKTVDENTDLTFAVNATDIDDDFITYGAVVPIGSKFNTTTGVFSWIPSFEDSGIYNVTIVASDSDLETPDISETITITVNNVNRAPIINLSISDIIFDEDGTKVIDMDYYFSDPDGTALTYTITGNTNVQFDGLTNTFNAASNWFGTEATTVHASDGEAEITDVMIVNVTAVNDAPFISPVVADITTAEDTVKTVDLTANEHDVDNSDAQITWSITDVNTSVFTASIDANDVLTITPANNMNGSDIVTLALTDGSETVTQDIEVTITPVNDTPLVGSITGTVLRQ